MNEEYGRKQLSYRNLKQQKIELDESNMNPVLKKLILRMNQEHFMEEEPNVLIRLEEYKKKFSD